MYHQESHETVDKAHGAPTIFARMRVPVADMEWILKDKPGTLEADAVLFFVDTILSLVPGKFHDRFRIDDYVYTLPQHVSKR